MGVAAVVWILTLAVAAGAARHPVLITLVVAFILALALVRRRASVALFVPAALAVAALGWRASADFARDCDAVERCRAVSGAATVAIDGVVTSFPQAGVAGSTFELATSVEGRRVRLLVRSGSFNVAYGDRYRLRARFTEATPLQRRFNASRGLAGALRVRMQDMVLIGCGGNPVLRRVFWPLHRFARMHLARAMGNDAGLAIGMLLGERTQLGRPVRDAVRRLGITHLLAISGMHLTTLAGCVIVMTSLRPRWRPLVLLGALTLYTGTVGGVESLTRAYTMALILLATHASIRPVHPIDALAKALLVMAVASPLCLRSVGLQLSFAATFAVLMCLSPGWRRASTAGSSIRRWAVAAVHSLASAFVVSLAVEVFIAPLQLHHFKSLSMVGPVATVVFFVPVTLVLLGALPVAALAAVVPAQEWPGYLLGTFSLATTRAILACGKVAPDALALPEPNAWIYYAGLVVGWKLRRRPLGWMTAILLVVLAFVVR